MKRIEKIFEEKASLIDAIKETNSRSGKILSLHERPLILSIDYDFSNQKLIETIGERNNWDILPAYDGENALHLFNKHVNELSFVFLQNRIPLIGGFELSHYFLERKNILSRSL